MTKHKLGEVVFIHACIGLAMSQVGHLPSFIVWISANDQGYRIIFGLN